MGTFFCSPIGQREHDASKGQGMPFDPAGQSLFSVSRPGRENSALRRVDFFSSRVSQRLTNLLFDCFRKGASLQFSFDLRDCPTQTDGIFCECGDRHLQ